MRSYYDRVEALRAEVGGRIDNGEARWRIQVDLESRRLAALSEEREEDADVIADVQDMLDGWCSPAMRL